MKRNYHTITKIGQANAGRLDGVLSRNGQALLPMVDLIEQSRLAVDELIDVAARATIEAVLELSAAQVAGPRMPGQRLPEVLWHGRQAGRVCLQERKLGVRKKGGGEAPIPAYEAMQDARLGRRMLDVLMRGISTRQYEEVHLEHPESICDPCHIAWHVVEESCARHAQSIDRLNLCLLRPKGKLIFRAGLICRSQGSDSQLPSDGQARSNPKVRLADHSPKIPSAPATLFAHPEVGQPCMS